MTPEGWLDGVSLRRREMGQNMSESEGNQPSPDTAWRWDGQRWIPNQAPLGAQANSQSWPTPPGRLEASATGLATPTPSSTPSPSPWVGADGSALRASWELTQPMPPSTPVPA